MKRTKTTNSVLNVKTKRAKTTNSLKCSVYLPDECWELVSKHLVTNDQDCSSLSVVSKRFLSITNRLRSSLSVVSKRFLSITNRFHPASGFKRTKTTNSVLNMRRKRTKTTNSMKFSVYLPNECWELVLKHLVMNDQDCSSLSLVSKQILSITNRLRSSLTIKAYHLQTTKEILSLIGRFPNLTSLNFIGSLDLDYILRQLSTFPFRLKSLKLSDIHTIPATGLVAFSITSTLDSLTCSYTNFLHYTHMFLIGSCFPKLQRLDLSHCNDIYVDSLPILLKGCCNITHLNLTACSLFNLSTLMDFQVPTLKVLNLSYTRIKDQTLYVITKSCTEIVQLSLNYCDNVTYKGVKSVLRNCKQLKEINLNGVKDNTIQSNVASMVLLRPSLKKITF